MSDSIEKFENMPKYLGVIFWLIFFLLILILLKFNNIIMFILNFVLTFSPSPNFLSDITGVLAAIIAISLPLSNDIISRISEKYESHRITNYLLEKCGSKKLLFIAIANIVFTIIIRFLVKEQTDSVLWKIFSWVALFWSIMCIYYFAIFASNLMKYMKGIESVINDLFQKAERYVE